MSNKNRQQELNNLAKEIVTILKDARSKTYQKATVNMLTAYWTIGQTLVKQGQKKETGKSQKANEKALIQALSKKLQATSPLTFSESNLRDIRLFYQKYPRLETVCFELNWMYYKTLLHINGTKKRLFYQRTVIQEKWSVRTLQKEIASGYYEDLKEAKNMLVNEDLEKELNL